MNTKPKQFANKFVSHFDQENFLQYGLEYVETYLAMSFWLIKPDMERTTVDDVYGVVDKETLHFKDPIEIKGIIDFEKPSLEAYVREQGLAHYNEFGNINISIHRRTLENLGVQLDFGDYIAYQIFTDMYLFFQVANDEKAQFENSTTFAGGMPYYVSITGVPVANQKELQELL